MSRFWKFWWYIPDYFDKWRLFPRAFITMYIYLLWKVTDWFMNLPDPNTQQAGLVSVVVGAGAAWFGLYVNSSGSRGPEPFNMAETQEEEYRANTHQEDPYDDQ